VSKNPGYWVAFMRMRELTKEIGAMEMLPHSVNHPGPINVKQWLLSLPGNIGPQLAANEWVERRYRLSDDMADKVGHKFIVAQMCTTAYGQDYIHFFKWQSLGFMCIMAGDDSGNLYPMTSITLSKVCNWVTDQQEYWCKQYHHDHGGAPNEGNAEVPTDFKGLADLIAGIAAKAQKPPKGGA
jgi:hypothetical protein